MLSLRPRRDGFAILETQKTWNPSQWLKCSVCPWFSLCGTSLSRGGMSESKLLERVLRRSWLGCWLLSYTVVSDGMEGRTFSFSRPVDGISPSSLPSPMRSQVFQPVKSRSPTLRLPPREVRGDTGEGLCARVIDGPDLSIVLEEQLPGRVVHRMIVSNYQLNISVQLTINSLLS